MAGLLEAPEGELQRVLALDLVERGGDAVRVEAEGLSVVFDRAVMESTDDALIITVRPADAGE